MSTRKLSISIRRERKNAVPIRNFKSPNAQPLRSISLDHSINNQIEQRSSLSPDGRGTLTTEVKSELTTENGSQITRPEYPSLSQPRNSMDAIVTYSSADRRMKRLLSPGNPGQSSNALLNIQLRKRSLNKKKMSKKSPSNVGSISRTTTDSETEKETKAKGSI